MASVPQYPVDTSVNIIAPPSGSYNYNSSSVQPSGLGISATADYYIETQGLDLYFFRQNTIVPTTPWNDPHNAVPVTSTFDTTPTHNRIICGGDAYYYARIELNATYSPSAARVPMNLVALGAASGTAGNGLYTSGNGHVQTYALGYKRRLATSADTIAWKHEFFTFPILTRLNGWSTSIPGDSINTIVRLVANEIQTTYIPEFDVNLIAI